MFGLVINTRQDRIHLPNLEGAGVDASKRILIPLLYRNLQIIDHLILFNVNREGLLRHVENPADELKLVI